MNTKIYKNRKNAIQFAKLHNGEIQYFDKPDIRKIKSKRTGRYIYKPTIRTFYKVTY